MGSPHPSSLCDATLSQGRGIWERSHVIASQLHPLPQGRRFGTSTSVLPRGAGEGGDQPIASGCMVPTASMGVGGLARSIWMATPRA